MTQAYWLHGLAEPRLEQATDLMYHLSRFSALQFAFRPPNPPQGTEQMDTRILKRMKHKNDRPKTKRT